MGFSRFRCIIDKCRIGEKERSCIMGYATNLCSKKDLLGIVARTSFSLAWRRLRSLSQFQIVRFRQAVHASLRRRLRIKIFVKFLSIVISIARIYMKFSNNVRTSSIKLGESLWFSISLKANVTRNTFSRKFSRQIYSSKFQPGYSEFLPGISKVQRFRKPRNIVG